MDLDSVANLTLRVGGLPAGQNRLARRAGGGTEQRRSLSGRLKARAGVGR